MGVIDGSEPTGEATKEGVALRLMLLIANAEGVSLRRGKADGTAVTRQWILVAYRDCLRVVDGGDPGEMKPTESLPVAQEAPQPRRARTAKDHPPPAAPAPWVA